MPQVIRVRDVARGGEAHELGPEEPALRVPYDMFWPRGPATRNGDAIDWIEGNTPRMGRFVEIRLGDCSPGERVLVRVPPALEEEDWWLVEVETVDGVSVA
jgi:hypothetical protein